MSFRNSEPETNREESKARRRRSQRRIIPHGKNSRVKFLDQLTRQATPSLTYFVLVLVAAIMSGIALVTDAPAFYLLTILMVPFMAPVVGLSLGTLVGSWPFFLQSIVGVFISCVLFFGAGTVAGWMVTGSEPANFIMAHHLGYVSVADLLLLSFGAVFTIYRLAKKTNEKPGLVSAALAYEILLPAAVTGFGLTSGIDGLFISALTTLLLHISWAILLGAIVLAFLGLRPNGWLGYAMTGAVIVVSLIGAIVVNGSIQLPQMPHLEAAVIPTVRPTSGLPTATKTPLPTETEDENITGTTTPKPTTTNSPTRTATVTSTKQVTPTLTLEPTAVQTTAAATPEPRLAIIDAKEGNGAIFRTGPYISATTVDEPYTTLLNGIYVKLYETVSNEDGEWGHIRLVSDDSIEGWVLRSLLSVESD